MKIKDQLFIVVTVILLAIILFLRACTPIIETVPVHKVSYVVTVDTVYQDRFIVDSIPYPVPSKQVVIKEATYQDTCPPIIESTYVFPITDSLVTGLTTIVSTGDIMSFRREFKVREKEIIKTATLTVEKPIPLKNQYFLGMDIGGDFKTDVPALGLSFMLVGTKGYAVSLRRDLIQGQTTFGAHIKLGKK